MLTSNQRNWAVFFAAIAVTVALSLAYVGVVGLREESVRALLRWSARAAFLVLLLVFVARPLQQLFRTPFTARILRNRRLLGITFAGIHTAHLGLIFYRASFSDDFEFRIADNLTGMLVYIVMLLMFATSFDATTRMLGRRQWNMLHKLGLYVLFIAFVDAVRPHSLDISTHTTSYLLTALAFFALLLRAVNAILLNRSKAQRSEP